MNSLQKSDAGAVDIVRPKPVDIEALLVAAMEKGPDIVERMMAVRRELNAEQAKAAFDQSIRDFQAECPAIKKTRKVEGLYNYAPFENILAIVRPYLQKHGLSFSLDTDTESKDGWVIAICRITHVGGHSEDKRGKFPLGAGTRAMSATQVYASAMSFASRRVFCNALGIVTEGEDMDGGVKTTQKGPSSKAEPKVEPPSEPVPDAKALQEKLWALLKDVRGTNWNTAKEWLAKHKIISGAEKITGMTGEELAIVIEKAGIVLAEGGE